MSERVSDERLAELIASLPLEIERGYADPDALACLRDLAAARAELNQYRLSPQLGCSVEAEVWHQLRMKMDAALGPDFDPYVRGECFAALEAIIGQRDEALGLLRDVGTDGRFSLSAVNSDEADDWYDKRDALLRKVGM